MEGTATISACGSYRYDLSRYWGFQHEPFVTWIMLNPSTADATENDQTIRKVQGFTQRMGRTGFWVVNLFAFRAREPKAMKRARDPVGPDNDDAIIRRAMAAPVVMCAWGPHGHFGNRDRDVLKLLRDHGVKPKCLIVTASGAPGHPLMLGYDRPILDYAP